MTPQEVLAALIKQGGASMDSVGACRLRGLNGRKCALGWLIPDEAYHPIMEIQSLAAMALALDFSTVSPIILRQMQCAHDVASRSSGNWADLITNEWKARGLPT